MPNNATPTPTSKKPRCKPKKPAKPSRPARPVPAKAADIPDTEKSIMVSNRLIALSRERFDERFERLVANITDTFEDERQAGELGDGEPCAAVAHFMAATLHNFADEIMGDMANLASNLRGITIVADELITRYGFIPGRPVGK